MVTQNVNLNPVDWLGNYGLVGNDIIIGQLSDFPTLRASEADGSTGKIQSVLYSLMDVLYRNSLNNVSGSTLSNDVFYITKSQDSRDLGKILCSFDVNLKMRVKSEIVNGVIVQDISTKKLISTAVTGLTAVSNFTSGDVDLSWVQESTTDAVSYMIYRTVTNVSPSVEVAPLVVISAPSTSYSDTSAIVDLTEGETYYYWMRTFNGQTYSEMSVGDSVVYLGKETYLWTGAIDGDLSKIGNYSPAKAPTSVNKILVDETCTNMPLDGSSVNNTFILTNNGTVPAVRTVSIGAACMIDGTCIFNGSVDVGTRTDYFCANYGTIWSGIFNAVSFNNNGGGVYCAVFNDGAYNYGQITNGTFNDDCFNGNSTGLVTNGIFNGSSYNDLNCTVVNGEFYGVSYNNGDVTTGNFYENSYNNFSVDTGAFYGNSNNNGAAATVTTGYFYPTSDGLGGWTYTTNTGTVDTATCYWIEDDYDFETTGTVTNSPPDYAGYPV